MTSRPPSAADRLSWLGARLDDAGTVTIGASAVALGVSEMTIRRDLEELERRGTARRIRGGARALGPQTFAEHHDRAARAKTQIADKLVDLIPSSGAIALDASSTVLRLAASIDRARDLTVITNGPDTFAALRDRPGVHALLSGGRLDDRTGSFVGPLACRTAESMAVDRYFMSAAALNDGAGPHEATLDDAEVKRTTAEVAAEVILAVDSSKLAQRAVASSIEWAQVDLLVTELDPTDDRLAGYAARTDVR